MGEATEGEAKADDEKVAKAEAEALEQEEAHQKAEAEYEAKQKEMEKTEADMKEASKKLRKFRRDEDAGGGVSYEKPCKKPSVPMATPAPGQPCEKSGAAMPCKLQHVFLTVLV